MRPEEIVEVRVNGSKFTGWTDVTVKRSLEKNASSFSLSIVEKPPSGAGVLSWPIKAGDAVDVMIGGVRAIRGYVDSRQGAWSFTDHTLQIDGRSKTGDMIDCSADEPKGEFKGVTLDALARRLLKPFGLQVTVKGDMGAPFPVVRLQPGETPFEVIERLARNRGLYVTDDEEGNLVLADGEALGEAAPVELAEGKNVLAASESAQTDKKHSKVKVKGQRPRVTDEDEAADEDESNGLDDVEDEAEDDTVGRHRPLILPADEPGDKAAMKDRAEREVAKRKAEGVEYSVTVQGFFARPGRLWTPGDRVRFASPMLQVDRELAIKEVEFKQSFGEGSITQLSLCQPSALKKGKGGKKGAKGAAGEKGATSTTGDTSLFPGAGGGDRASGA